MQNATKIAVTTCMLQAHAIELNQFSRQTSLDNVDSILSDYALLLTGDYADIFGRPESQAGNNDTCIQEAYAV